MTVEQCTIVPGPAAAASIAELSEKKLAKVLKEGGKRGVEIEGAADMGGLKFFCCAALEPAGDLDQLVETVKAMNALVDPTEEERRGGSGRVGKMVQSYHEDGLAMVAYVPSDLSGECNATEWLNQIIADCGVKQQAEACGDCNTANWAKVLIKTDGEDVFAIKYRDVTISHAYNYLRKRDLFPEDDDESDDDFVFGDEDFPSPDDEEEAVKEEEVAESVETKEDEEEALPNTIVPGPEAAASIAEIPEKRLAKVLKEGGKRGVEIEGAADMGGLKFFCCAALEPAGDLDLLCETVKAMNALVDPTEEERRGGSGRVGKMVQSYHEEGLALVTYVPSDLSGECNATEWLNQIIADCGVKQQAEPCGDCDTANWAKVLIKTDGENVFAIKYRDVTISHAYNYLRKRDLFPEDDEESDDDYVFGDEDFPEF